MQKTMKDLCVSTRDGSILIEQEAMGQEGMEMMGVAIHPDQLPLLIQWLQEAEAELKNEPRF